jgi:tocopherol cyclase
MHVPGPYRSSGADLPFGALTSGHGVAMEGYFWRFTDLVAQRVVTALIGVQRSCRGPWALVGLGAHPGRFWRQRVLMEAEARQGGPGARAGSMFFGDDRRIVVDLAPDARLDVTISDLKRWPRTHPFGGSSWFQLIPGLNQYWHPWLLGGRATGAATIGAETWQLNDAQVYAEKNWGSDGFPTMWWWGQAQGFAEQEACIAFAGGEVSAGRFRTKVTAVVVRLPDGTLLRLGNPGTSPVRATVTDDSWVLTGHSRGWQVELEGQAPLAEALVLPVPLVEERRAAPGALEHLGATVSVRVRNRGRLVWAGTSRLAGLEHGGLARAPAEARRREA